MVMIYFKEHYATIQCDEKLKVIEVAWYGHIRSKEYREIMQLALNLVKEKKLKRWLADMKDMARIQISDAEWREKVWFPEFVKTDIEKVAAVISPDYFNE